MAASSVQVEIVPVANKPRYEKRLIGQIFSSDDKDSTLLTKSPMVVRTRPDAQLETKPNPKVDIKRPETRVRTPEPVLRNASPVQLHSGHGSLERGSPTPPPGAGGSSPTSRLTNPNQSPLANKSSTLPGLSNITNKKGGKRIKIDLKKGKYFLPCCLFGEFTNQVWTGLYMNCWSFRFLPRLNQTGKAVILSHIL